MPEGPKPKCTDLGGTTPLEGIGVFWQLRLDPQIGETLKGMLVYEFYLFEFL